MFLGNWIRWIKEVTDLKKKQKTQQKQKNKQQTFIIWKSDHDKEPERC